VEFIIHLYQAGFMDLLCIKQYLAIQGMLLNIALIAEKINSWIYTH